MLFQTPPGLLLISKRDLFTAMFVGGGGGGGGEEGESFRILESAPLRLASMEMDFSSRIDVFKSL